jgi:uncharacterized protein with PIN domain
MRFWDTSALVPLLVDEPETDYCLQELAEDQEILMWCLTEVEAVSALTRRAREDVLAEEDYRQARARLGTLLESAYEVTAIRAVRQRACRLLQVHRLRAAAACQIGAALVACREMPERMVFMCLDGRLRSVALKEGFVVNPQP